MAREWHDSVHTAHAVIFRNCNFHCGFCNNDFRPEEPYRQYNHDEFVSIVCNLLPWGKYFKFTGGEPTLNSDIERDIQIVKDLGGFVFLDTNGSFPEKIEQLIERNLIDVVGISLKGLSAEQALKTSSVKDSKYCWENVWRSIRLCNNTTKTIVTYVMNNNTSEEEIIRFVDLILPFHNTSIKINNLMYERHHSDEIKPISEPKLSSYIERLVIQRPKARGRIIYVPNENAINNYSMIKFY